MSEGFRSLMKRCRKSPKAWRKVSVPNRDTQRQLVIDFDTRRNLKDGLKVDEIH